MGQAKRRGTLEERIAHATERALANQHPTQFFGYNRERHSEESPFELSEDGLVCMVSSISGMNLVEIRQHSGIDFKLGDWFCSTGAHEKTAVHGPFSSEEDAFDYAKEAVGAVRFLARREFY